MHKKVCYIFFMQDHNESSIVLLPSYQPEETLIRLSSALKELGFYVLIVDDGSGEKYHDIFLKCQEYAKVISYSKNMGKGYALKTGFKYIVDNLSEYKVVITADGDGQHCIQDIVFISNKAVERNMAVIGERHFEVKTPLKSRLGNGLSRFTQALCTYRYMRDNQCGLRAFPISSLKDLLKIRGNRYEYEMSVLTFLQTKEIPYITVPVKTIYEDNNRTTHFRPLQDTLLIQGSILKCGLINIVTLLLGVVVSSLLFYYVFQDNVLNVEISTFLTTLFTFVFHSAVNLIIYRPKNFGKSIVRVLLFELIFMTSLVIMNSFFVRIFNWAIYASYLVCIFLSLFPFYELIKGVGLVYSSQND